MQLRVQLDRFTLTVSRRSDQICLRPGIQPSCSKGTACILSDGSCLRGGLIRLRALALQHGYALLQRLSAVPGISQAGRILRAQGGARGLGGLNCWTVAVEQRQRQFDLWPGADHARCIVPALRAEADGQELATDRGAEFFISLLTRCGRRGFRASMRGEPEKQSLGGFFMAGFGSGECLPAPVMEIYYEHL